MKGGPLHTSLEVGSTSPPCCQTTVCALPLAPDGLLAVPAAVLSSFVSVWTHTARLCQPGPYPLALNTTQPGCMQDYLSESDSMVALHDQARGVPALRTCVCICVHVRARPCASAPWVPHPTEAATGCSMCHQAPRHPTSQIKGCDGILGNMESVLSFYQADLGRMGEEIRQLQVRIVWLRV